MIQHVLRNRILKRPGQHMRRDAYGSDYYADPTEYTERQSVIVNNIARVLYTDR